MRAHVKDPVVHVIMMDYGNAKTPSMRRRLNSATLSELAFPGGGGGRKPEIPMGEVQ